MIAAIAFRPNTATITPPSGWTLIRRTDQSAATASSQATYYRVAGGSEPSSYQWTFNSTTGIAGGITTFYDVNTFSLVDVENGQTTASGTSHAAPSVTTTVNNAMVVTTHSFTSCELWTPPGGMTEAVDVSSDAAPNVVGIALEMNYVLQSSLGATGSKTATVGGNADAGVGQTVALTPAPKTWDGGAGTNNWGDGNNWNPNGVPTSTDSVYLTGANTIDANVAAVCRAITLNNSSLVVTIKSGYSLTVSGSLTHTAGTLKTEASFPSVSGTVSLNGGTVDYSASSGSQTVSAQTYNNLTISGGGTKTLAGNASIQGNLSITGCVFDLGSYTANRATSGGNIWVGIGNL